ncbi:hypothetical protein EG339_16000 [Chryseobacterium bernardetii]|uniref:Uncharacterized protein n=1 Tax=Chryseobacterium bernardetii TaxID=1241978 RepID=A0A3G6T9R7_9FLAO|nr:hypothetical protein EG339_16000 [Chryseobacterium bernardetii]
MLIINILSIYFKALKNLSFSTARCVFVYTNFSSFTSKDSFAFFAKRGKNCGACFLFSLKSGLRFQTHPIYSFLISKDSRIIQTLLI